MYGILYIIFSLILTTPLQIKYHSSRWEKWDSEQLNGRLIGPINWNGIQWEIWLQLHTFPNMSCYFSRTQIKN